MRDFSWRYFESTGEIDAYLLYKEHQNIVGNPFSEAEMMSQLADGETRTE